VSDSKVPVFHEYMNPILAALEAMGGAATNDALDERVLTDMGLDPALLDGNDNSSFRKRTGWARTYLKKGGLISNPERATWVLTDEGRRRSPIDERELVTRIQARYGKDGPDDIDEGPREIPPTWPERLAAMRADAAFMARHRERDERRREVRDDLRELFADFQHARISLPELRDIYDRRTRTDWNVFGLKGMSGAMFLNTLVKHLPEHSEEISALVRAAMALPESEPNARARMRGLHDRLVELIDAGVITARNVQPTRVPFFVSSTWHVESPDEWPAYYESMREPLRDFYAPTENVVETYFRFAAGVRKAREQLGISTWELEHLCEWVTAARAQGDVPQSNTSPSEARVWAFNPGRENREAWDRMRDAGVLAIDAYGLGDLRAFASIDAVRDAVREKRGPGAREPVNAGMLCWDFAHEMKPGDEVFVRFGLTTVIAYGVVESAYRFDPEHEPLRHLRDVKWIWTGERTAPRPLVSKTLTDVTDYEDFVSMLREVVGPVVSAPPPERAEALDDDDPPAQLAYTIEDAARDLFRSREEIERLRDLVIHRKNVILAGPPGVGKTFVAKRLAALVAGVRDDALVTMVQFHQSYAYEDFVQGYRPTESGGFARRDGPFLDFCDAARKRADQPHVLVIDEINRGNLSKIFGELLMLIEPDKRTPEWKVRLAYGKPEERFSVPPNVHIIGTMNTADRSLAVVDYALRRRFAFVDLRPKLDDRGFEAWLTSKGADPALVARIRDRIGRVNAEIEKDPQLGAGYLIGHSYFSAVAHGQVPDDAWYERIIDLEIDPLLREYWFDRLEQAEKAVARLKSD
jgi:hypothetical protein